MKTKFGEIKSILDLFEDLGENKFDNEGSCQRGLEHFSRIIKCKLCGDKFIVPTFDSCLINDEFDRTQREHIQLHKDIEGLNL